MNIEPLVGSKPGSRSTGRDTKTLIRSGEPCGTRTHDPLIKSQFQSQLQGYSVSLKSQKDRCFLSGRLSVMRSVRLRVVT